MAKVKTQYVCQNCGSVAAKWVGKCEACESWNTFVQESMDSIQTTKSKLPELNLQTLHSTTQTYERFQTANSEFDRVLGGGLVPGSVVLIGGDPGIGKSTLLLQIAAALSQKLGVLYVSGEEGIDQIRLRAQRLNVTADSLTLASATSLSQVVSALDQTPSVYSVAIIDSIQTMVHEHIESAAGTVSQVRACAQELVHIAKKRNVAIFIVGHVTKEGTLAGPRVLEHLVDTVLYFEGDKGYQYRLLRTVKNRFGPTDEIGVFEMGSTGLKAILNPSHLFLTERTSPVSGTAVFAGMEGTRPLLIEFQALLSSCAYGMPRRVAVGYDQGRLSMILAVLESRGGLKFGQKDVYLNVAGGLKITEPASDLAVAAAVISAYFETPFYDLAIFFGELSLAGEIRPVSQPEARLKEASKLGFNKAFIPQIPQNLPDSTCEPKSIKLIQDLVKLCYQLKKHGETHDRNDYTQNIA
jgi:DNA repair protein RadA/Sms